MEPRFRFYNSPRNYFLILRHLLFNFVQVDKKSFIHTLEDKLCKLAQAKNAILVPQNRVGLYLCVKHALDPTRPKVIVPAYTIYDSVNMVIAAGGQPVFVDVNEETCSVCLDGVEKQLDQGVSVVIVAHLHGKVANIGQLVDLCRRNKVAVVEDYAQAFGAKLGGEEPSLLADARVLSFGRAKNVNAFYGGAILSNDNGLMSSIRDELSSFAPESWVTLTKRIILCLFFDVLASPIIFKYVTIKLMSGVIKVSRGAAYNIVQTEKKPRLVEVLPDQYRRNMTPLQARLVLDQLHNVDSRTQSRQKIADIYYSLLATVPHITLPTASAEEPHIFLQFPILMDRREDFAEFARQRGCDIPLQHLNNLPDLQVFQDYFSDCPVSRSLSRKVVLLPTYPGYSEAQAKKNVAVLKEFLAA